ncbi:MAG: hypothetical protein A2161_01625 [Candidatus Schekmanbacteria bacterium RBG_13_48_7]|uniref:LD-carboxypeptidase n=1 Tax=Candidatus Schekmanbacteria bacterium RBG_13_48_7 TaxID=1817878 RepID=A0A1F7RP35_9BACT|nr:MAG: hypothetical protein A2161_01625 [Candidatus Schekmanbacteria bacterium RBG_13_48_7]
MMADPEVNAIFCARGGYGSARILPYIDLNLFSRNPKIILGFSDITILLLCILKSANIVTFHGPMVSKLGSNCHAQNIKCLIKILSNTKTVNLSDYIPADYSIDVFRHGQGSGFLVGGCLSLLQTCLGTDLNIDLKGKILFWEEVGEKVYRLDRMIEHLYRAGCFKELSGMIIGKLSLCFSDRKNDKQRFFQLLSKYFGEYKYPILYNVPIGHTILQMTLPEGSYCQIDTTGPNIIIKKQHALENLDISSTIF